MSPHDLGTAGAGAPVAAVDLGSNSFHMVVGRVEPGPRLVVLDRMKERVRIAAGLQGKYISDEAAARGLACLARFGERIGELPHTHVRAVGTDTFRRAQNGERFLARAQEALGHRIEIVSGQEEARLVYQGVDQSVDPPEADRRLVVDIGGGSTEVITGQGSTPGLGRSLHMGCVSFSQKYFPEGRITKAAFSRAMSTGGQLLGRVSREFRSIGWDHALGSSGTIKAIERVLLENGLSPAGITRQGLRRLREEMVAAGSVDALKLKGLGTERAQVLPGGLAVLSSVFAELPIETMVASPSAMREGLLRDLVGRLYSGDLRDGSVARLMERLQADQAQADRVQDFALSLFDAAQNAWDLRPRHRRLLRWAAQLHEVGRFISFSGYQRHGAYILENGEMPGFSLQDKRAIAFLVRTQRGKLAQDELKQLSEDRPRLVACMRLLRIAVSVHRRRSPKELALPTVGISGRRLTLSYPSEYLSHRPMTRDGLLHESKRQDAVGLPLIIR